MAAALADSGLDLQIEAKNRLLNSATELDETPGLVRPITLNVVGYVLASGQTAAPSLDAGQLIRRYIEQTVNQPELRDLAPRVLEKLVTEQATKQPRSEQELASETGLRRAEVRAVLIALGEAALARPLDAAQGIWELSHDFIARAMARYLGRQRRVAAPQRRVCRACTTRIDAVGIIVAGVIANESLSGRRSASDLRLALASCHESVAVLRELRARASTSESEEKTRGASKSATNESCLSV